MTWSWDGQQIFLQRHHGLRLGLDERRGKAQEWCRNCGLRVQKWKNRWNVEKSLKSGKTAGNGEKAAILG